MSIRELLDDQSKQVFEYKNTSRVSAVSKANVISIKSFIHSKLLEEIDLDAMEKMSGDELKEQLKDGVKNLVLRNNLVVTEADLSRLVSEIQNEVIGLGPLEILLADRSSRSNKEKCFFSQST